MVSDRFRLLRVSCFVDNLSRHIPVCAISSADNRSTVRPLLEELLDKFDPSHNEAGPQVYMYFGDTIRRNLASLNQHCP